MTIRHLLIDTTQAYVELVRHKGTSAYSHLNAFLTFQRTSECSQVEQADFPLKANIYSSLSVCVEQVKNSIRKTCERYVRKEKAAIHVIGGLGVPALSGFVVSFFRFLAELVGWHF